MFADTDEELHHYAFMLGLKPEWFQQPPKASWRHYDLTENKRKQAIKLGAIPMNLSFTPYFAFKQRGIEDEAERCWKRFVRKSLDNGS